jgi:hypothetical protein
MNDPNQCVHLEVRKLEKIKFLIGPHPYLDQDEPRHRCTIPWTTDVSQINSRPKLAVFF